MLNDDRNVDIYPTVSFRIKALPADLWLTEEAVLRRAGSAKGVHVSVFRYLQADLEHFDLRDLKGQFDVILLEPPLEEYYRESGISHTERFWTWDDVCMHASLAGLHLIVLNGIYVRLVCRCVCMQSGIKHNLSKKRNVHGE